MTIPRALAGIRVLDFTWVRAGPWATRWLGAFGADIVKIEWPEHLDILRSNRTTIPPGMDPSPNAPGQFADTNVNKRGVTINVRMPRGLELIKRLITISDVVIENFSSRVMRTWGIGYDVMQQLKADIIYVSMAGFGHTGRHHHYTTMGPSAQALSGQTFLSGLPGKPPAGWGWSYLDDTGGMYGAMCVLTALHHRNATGHGQHIDLSQMTAGITLTGAAFLDHTVNGRAARREGYPPGNRTAWPGTTPVNNYRGPTVAPHNAYRTQGGGHNDWCVIACFSDAEWQTLVDLMGRPGWATDAKFGNLSGRLQHQEELDEGIGRWTHTIDKYELTEKCQAVGVRAMPVQSAEDRVERDPQLKARGMYPELDHPLLGRRKVQSVPFKHSKTPAAVHRPAPLIGQHTRQVLQELLGLSLDDIRAGYTDGTFWPKDMPLHHYIEETLRMTAAADVGTSGSPTGPLAGLRVLELADEKGQFCGKLIADLGADVIKIEPPGGQHTRAVGPFLNDIPHRERSLSFWHYNTSKRGITLNLKTLEGRGLFHRLVPTTDILLETYPPGYLPGLGLEYEELSRLNPRLIMCSLTPFGQTGPWRDYQTSDLLQLAAGGQMGCCGYDPEDVPDAPPIAPGGGNAWHIGSHFAYIAIMAALCYRDVTGEGQYIDASVHEACALTTEAAIPTYIYTGNVVQRHTGRAAAVEKSEPTQYITRDGSWLNTTRSGFNLTPARLRRLAEWMDKYGLAQDLLDEKYQSPAAIQANVSHIAAALETFFAGIPLEEAWHGGQKLGLPWGAIRSMDEILADQHLQDREFFTEVSHPELGRSFTYPGPAALYSKSPWRISRRAPLIGEHNAEIFCGELGLSQAELVVLAESGVV